jgi:hypothetical protein
VGSVVVAPPYNKISTEMEADGKYCDGEELDKPFEEPATYQGTYQGYCYINTNYVLVAHEMYISCTECIHTIYKVNSKEVSHLMA